MRHLPVPILCVALLCWSLGHAQDGKSDGANGMSDLTSQKFVTRAAESNFAEISTSQLALSKTQNPEVRKFAQQMIDDHTQANSQLAQLAKTKNLKVPVDTDLMHRTAAKLLGTKSGESFDTAYVKQMDKDHQKAVELFQAASSSNGVDQDLRAMAGKLLPILQHHHEMVAQLESKQGNSTASR
jgi:putative membrane protein